MTISSMFWSTLEHSGALCFGFNQNFDFTMTLKRSLTDKFALYVQMMLLTQRGDASENIKTDATHSKNTCWEFVNNNKTFQKIENGKKGEFQC